MAVHEHLQPGEEILFRAHPTRLPLIAPLAATAAVLLAGLLLSGRVQDSGLVWIGVLIFAAALLGYAGVVYLRLRSREYILTNQRLIHQEGLVAKRSIDSYLGKINNIEHVQTFWGRLLGYGDLKIDTANAAEPSVFSAIADPLGFKRAISAAAETYRLAGSRPAPAVAAPSGADRLRQLKSLLDDGLISQAEFDAKRQQLLAEI